MAEQSSSVVAVRGLVILVCLVLVPVAAFWGGSFPSVWKAIQSGRWPTFADFHHSAEPRSTAETVAPRFVPPAAKPVQPTGAQAPGFASQTGGLGAEATHSQVVAANYTAPLDIAPPVLSIGPPPEFSQGQARSPANQPSAALAATMQKALPLGNLGVGKGAGVEQHAGMQSKEVYEYVQKRLKQLGATHYILETFGDETREFRFYCVMSVRGNPRVTKPFWCTENDALKAMTGVLKQVEEWHSGGG